MNKEVEEWARFLTRSAGKVQEEEEFIENLKNSPGVLKELTYYYTNRDFLCEYKVDGFSIVDLLVWQVDHFKAYLDRPDEMNRYHQDRLVWSAFHTMLHMEKDGGATGRKMAEQTGTDFEGKSF